MEKAPKMMISVVLLKLRGKKILALTAERE